MTLGVARAYIGFGSNLDDPVAQVRAGIAAVRALAGTRGLRCSSLYRSAPIGMTAQPDFINAACALDTSLSPEVLLDSLLAIERIRGRRRGAPGGPRTLDLDLLLYAEQVTETPHLSLPHPRLHERAFVLYPLAELDPGLEVPGRGYVTDLLKNCGSQAIEKLSTE